MEILIIIALIVAGLILFFIEVFLVPGITGRLYHPGLYRGRHHRHHRMGNALENGRPAFAEERA